MIEIGRHERVATLRFVIPRFIIAVVMFVVALFIGGCASTPKGRAVQVVVASDGIADEVAEQWAEKGHARIDKCRAEYHETEAARTECMGVFVTAKDELVVLLETLVAAQMAIKLAVECDSNPLKMPKEFLTKCGTEKQADWKALYTQVMNAVEAIRPILQEIRK
jgi:hypothetical protein